MPEVELGSNNITVNGQIIESVKSSGIISKYGVAPVINTNIELLTGVNGWRLVRFLPPSSTVWFSGNDNLEGTRQLNQTTRLITQEWSILFGEFDEFCFSTLNFTYWLYCTKDAVNGSIYTNLARPIIKSSFSPNASYSALWYNRGSIAAPMDPWISVQNHDIEILYGENSNAIVHTGSSAIIANNGGMCVWVRDSRANLDKLNDNSLILYYKFDGDIINDAPIKNYGSLGKSHDGYITLTNGLIVKEQGEVSPFKFRWTSTSDYNDFNWINLPSNLFDSLNDGFSISWFSKDYNVSDVEHTFIIDSFDGSDLYMLAHLPWNNNRIYFDINDSFLNNSRLETAFVHDNQLSNWILIKEVSGTQMIVSIWRNSILLATQTVNNVNMPTGNKRIRFGVNQPGTYRFKNKSFEDLRIYNRVLSPTEITVLYNMYNKTTQPITINDNYNYIPFLNTGANQTQYSITFPENTECDILIVGGGGGGGNDRGGGGGAGGLIFNQNLILNGTYNILVGAGGISNTTENSVGDNGINSSFGVFIALGGGGGAGEGALARSGGSGGGMSYAGNTFGSGLQPTSLSGGFGNSGGDSRTNNQLGQKQRGGGGGGGAGQSGERSTSTTVGGKGGDGLSGIGSIDFKTFFTLESNSSIGEYLANEDKIYFAGGGGSGECIDGTPEPSPHGIGGKGGGGDGKTNSNIIESPLNNSGGGGGGGGFPSYIGGNGGSGIVIIRYKIIKIPFEAQWTYNPSNPSVYHLGNVGIGTSNPMSALHVVGNVSLTGDYVALTKSFKIVHPLDTNKWLYHGCVEGPRFDNIYRGKKKVINGICEVDIDKECNDTGGMTQGTFMSLNMKYQVYIQNTKTFDGVNGNIINGKLIIKCENTKDEIDVNWLVIGERHDKNIINNKLTNNIGNLICEHNVD
jgi:hypothetical protein